MRRTFIALLLLLAPAPRVSGADRSVAGDIAVVVHPTSKLLAMTKAQLGSIFSSSRRPWDDGSSIVAFSYSHKNEVRQAFDLAVLGLSPDQVGRFWIDQRIRDGLRPPRQVPDATLMVRLVAQMGGSIGFIPAALADQSVRIVARVRNGVVLPP